MLIEQVAMLSTTSTGKCHIRLKKVDKQFFLKTKMTCDSRNLIYVVI